MKKNFNLKGIKSQIMLIAAIVVLILTSAIVVSADSVDDTSSGAKWISVEGIEGGKILFNEENEEFGTIEDCEETVTKANIPSSINGVKVVGINGQAFSACVNLESVIIPESITYLGRSLFEGLENLKSVTLPVGIKSIGNRLFFGCKQLENITIPEGVSCIESQTFYGCISIKEIILPSTIKSIGNDAFNGCKSLEEIDLPSSIESIGCYAFSECEKIESIKIPEGVKSIEYSAFSNCNSLKEINLPSSIENIGTQAFEGCKSLNEIDLPSALESIGWSAFRGCEELESIRIPEGVTDIGGQIFYRCKSLKNVILPSTLESIGWSAFRGCEELESIKIPEGVKSIEEGAFSDCISLKEINLPSAIESIGDHTFSRCEKLETITISNGVKRIGASAFGGCISLKSITIPESVIQIGDYAFSGCENLNEVIMPADIPEMGIGVFANTPQDWRELISVSGIEGGRILFDERTGMIVDCEDMVRKADIPSSINGIEVTGIGDNAFGGCSLLESITIPNGVKSIGVNAFYYCIRLKSITIPNGVKRIGVNAFRECKGLESITIPESVIQIGDYAFANCENLKEVIMPENIPEMGKDVFWGCIGYLGKWIFVTGIEGGKIKFDELTGTIVEVEGTVTKADIPSSINGVVVTRIEKGAFSLCNKLESITIPESVTYLVDSFFAGLENLKSVTLPIGMERISEKLFYDCKQLEEITIPDSVISIGQGAFYGCSSLKEILLPDTIKSIGPTAFSECDSLEQLVIPKMVMELGGAVLAGCDNLDTVEILGNISAIQSSTFSGCTKLENVSISSESYTIGDYAFFQCSNLQDLSFLSKATEIGMRAFEGCGVTELVLPQSVCVLGDRAFAKCSNLRAIIFECSQETIPEYLFAECYNVSEIKISEGIKCIEKNAFRYCEKLSAITLPESLERIEMQAFGGIYTQITLPKNIQYVEPSAFLSKELEKIEVSEENAVYTSEEGVLFDKEKTTLLRYPTGKKEENYVIPKSVKILGDRAFSNAIDHLKNLTLSENVESLGNSFFGIALCEINVDLANKHFSSEEGVLFDKEKTTLVRYPIERKEDTYVVPTGVKVFGERSFYAYPPGRINLKSITLSKDVEVIGENFSVKTLCEINVDPENKYFSSEDGVLFDKEKSTLIQYPCGKKEESYVIPKGVRFIANGAFPNSTEGKNLKALTLSEDIESLGEYYTGDSLCEINVNPANKHFSSIDGVLFDKTQKVLISYPGLREEKEYRIPDGVECIESRAFNGNRFLETLIIPQSVVEINDIFVLVNSDYDEDNLDVIILSLKIIFEGTKEEWEAATVNCILPEGVEVTFASLSVEDELTFIDVEENSYYYDAVLWAVEKGITTGLTTTSFGPYESCTRGQIVTFLWRAAGKPKSNVSEHSFTDVNEGSYYYDAMLWAVEKGITTGLTATSFAPDETCTRGQVVTFLWRAKGCPDVTLNSSSFTDVKKDSYYYNAMLWAVEKEITTGLTATSFAPDAIVDRSQSVTFLYRAYTS